MKKIIGIIWVGVVFLLLTVGLPLIMGVPQAILIVYCSLAFAVAFALSIVWFFN